MRLYVPRHKGPAILGRRGVGLDGQIAIRNGLGRDLLAVAVHVEGDGVVGFIRQGDGNGLLAGQLALHVVDQDFHRLAGAFVGRSGHEVELRSAVVVEGPLGGFTVVGETHQSAGLGAVDEDRFFFVGVCVGDLSGIDGELDEVEADVVGAGAGVAGCNNFKPLFG